MAGVEEGSTTCIALGSGKLKTHDTIESVEMSPRRPRQSMTILLEKLAFAVSAVCMTKVYIRTPKKASKKFRQIFTSMWRMKDAQKNG